MDDALVLLNCMGVYAVNKITANVAASVTAAIDPAGMGAHMGDEVKSAGDALCGKRKDLEDIETSERRMVVNTTNANTEVMLCKEKTEFFEAQTVHAGKMAAIAKKADEDKAAIKKKADEDKAATVNQAGENKAAIAKKADEHKTEFLKLQTVHAEKMAVIAKKAGEDKTAIVKKADEDKAATERQNNNDRAEHAERMADVAQRMIDMKKTTTKRKISTVYGGAAIVPIAVPLTVAIRTSTEKLLSVGTVIESRVDGKDMFDAGARVTIGMMVKRAYITKYGKTPIVQSKVAHYEKADRDLIDDAITEYLGV